MFGPPVFRGRGCPKRPRPASYLCDVNIFEVLSRFSSKPCGIDLAKRGIEVRKLFFAGFGRRVLQAGYDPEDVLQEVYQGILVRNQGKCPWDPAKSSFGHYVHMVASCVVSNYGRKHKRCLEEASETPPLGSVDPSIDWEVTTDLCTYLSETPEKPVALQVLPLLLSGIPKEKLTDHLPGLKPSMVNRSLQALKQATQVWKSHFAP